MMWVCLVLFQLENSHMMGSNQMQKRLAILIYHPMLFVINPIWMGNCLNHCIIFHTGGDLTFILANTVDA